MEMGNGGVSEIHFGVRSGGLLGRLRRVETPGPGPRIWNGTPVPPLRSVWQRFLLDNVHGTPLTFLWVPHRLRSC